MQERLTFWKLVADEKFKIRIPIIQRGYAQGRSEKRVVEVRKKFLDALYDAVRNNNKLLLDFIYGEKTKDNVFVPFDGQQRLTTLYLLHWYAAWREKKFDENDKGGEQIRDIFRRFSYETRESSRQFCEQLAKFKDTKLDDSGSKVSHSDPLAKHFMDQSWFLPGWEHDPTIAGMLVMLDEIHKKFCNVKDLWKILTGDNACIAFLFQPLDKLGSSADEIFIKMNARGKQLTEFEHFKAQFIEEHAHLAQKFDGDWQDLFWAQFGPARVNQNSADEKDWAQEVDACYCRYLAYLARMLCHLPSPSATSGDAVASGADQPVSLFERVKEAISRKPLCQGKSSNLDFIVASLESLHSLSQDGKDAIANWFDNIFSPGTDDKATVAGKIALYSRQTAKSTNLFHLCCLEDSPTRVNEFLFFGCLLALVYELAPEVARERLRILRNLLVNSENEFRVSNYAEQIKGIVKLMVDGEIDQYCEFNTDQLAEELAKQKLRMEYDCDKKLHDCLDWLENHPLLRGRLSAFANASLDQSNVVAFDCKALHEGRNFIEHTIGSTVILEDDAIDTLIRGLLSQGDYSLRIGKKCFLGGSMRDKMRDLFTSASMRCPLQSLACKTRKINSKPKDMRAAINKIADVWLAQMKKAQKMDWRWYFVKYPVMRPASKKSSGFYDWGGVDGYWNRPESFLQVQLTGKMRSSTNWNPFLWAVYTEAGFNKPIQQQPQWTDSRGYKDDPIVFSCGLALWPEEFSWRIGSPAGRNEDLTPELQQNLSVLCAKFPDIKDGILPVPGTDETDNATNIKYRLYDNEDRIALAVKVVQELAKLT